jgi:hypothetical protein
MKKPLKKLFLILLVSVAYVLFYSTKLKPLEQNETEKMVVSVSVADVRDQPKINKKAGYKTLDWEQVTQVLLGEKILVCERRNGWLRIKAPEQQINVKGKWYDSVGWIKESQATPVKEFPRYNLVTREALSPLFIKDKHNQKKLFSNISCGTQLLGTRYEKSYWHVKLPNGKIGYIKDKNVYDIASWQKRKNSLLRKSLLHVAHQFLDAPYFWGGRSSFNKKTKQLTSSDCSGLTNLCHRVHGIEIPKNSISQYIKSKKIKNHPRPGDLLFLSRKNNIDNIYHVMIYAGKDKLIEAKGDKIRKVRIITGKDFFGKHIKKITSGEKIGNDTIYFGTYL